MGIVCSVNEEIGAAQGVVCICAINQAIRGCGRPESCSRVVKTISYFYRGSWLMRYKNSLRSVQGQPFIRPSEPLCIQFGFLVVARSTCILYRPLGPAFTQWLNSPTLRMWLAKCVSRLGLAKCARLSGCLRVLDQNMRLLQLESRSVPDREEVKEPRLTHETRMRKGGLLESNTQLAAELNDRPRHAGVKEKTASDGQL